MNEFFKCPSYTYGAFLIMLIFSLVLYIYSKMATQAVSDADGVGEKIGAVSGAAGTMGMMILVFSVVGLGWALWVLSGFVSRDAACTPVGFLPGYGYMNPFGSGNQNPDYKPDGVVKEEKGSEGYY